MTAPIIENNYTGDGSTVLFSFTFEYIEATDIEVSIDNVTIATTEYSLANSTTIEFNTAPANGTAVRIYRNTTVNEPKATFFPGSAIRAQDLNDNFEQILFVTQEADAISERAETAADAAQTATTTAQAAAASANTAGAAAQASATAAQASATSAQTSATAAAADASQAATDAASAVATANTASTNASNAVTTANAASALISTAVLADGTRAMSGDLNVNSNKVVNVANPTAGGDAVNKSFADANYQPLDAELTELATMQNTTASALADLTQAEVLVLDGATVSTAELNTLDGITATTSELNTLDGITSTVGELNVLDGVTATTTELNITDGLTASTAELNQLDGKTISNVLTPANNNDIPTSSAVNTYVSGLLNALGGFVAIANESSFPTTNPDPSDDAGTVVSITDAGGLVVNSSGTSTSATTTGNATVTITGFPSSLHNTTLGNDLGLQVQTTSTLNTYTYHKLIAKESDVVRLSDDINDFNARYRVSATAPTTDLDAGDLWFDTTAGKMKVYDANDSAWEEVQSVGNFFINTLSSSSGTGGGSSTFNGSAYRFTLSNAGANAQQMLVSINGVVQKPNSGTSQPSEGFAIDTNDIIFAAAPASGASYFIVTIGSSVNIGQPSNNTVDTSELVDGAVTNAKVSSSAAIASSKLAKPIDFADSEKARFGNSQDLQIYHDGSASYIDDTGTGALNIRGNYLAFAGLNGEQLINAEENAAVELFHNGTKKLETKSDGIDVTGEVQCDSLDVDGTSAFANQISVSGAVEMRRSSNDICVDVGQTGVGTKARINADGSVSFATGNFQVNDDGAILVDRNAATKAILNGYQSSSLTSHILADGSAHFSGDVGIGTTSNYADSKLEVRGTNAGGDVALRVTNNSTASQSQAGIIFTTTTADYTTAGIGFQRGDNALKFYVGQTAGGGGFDNATERMRIHADGTLAVPNGIFLDPGLVSGSTANILEDYEEGTFTPIWTTTGTNFSSVTYTNQDGKYTKIGNIVHVSLRLRSSASSGGSGNLLVGGLPYNCNDSAGSGGGSPSTFNINYHNSTINVATETRSNNNQFYLLSSTDGGGWSNVDYGGIMGNGVSEIRVSFDYITNS